MKSPLEYSLTTRYKDRHILDLLSPLGGKRVLDVGCGIGYLAGLFACNGATVVGTDIDSSALRHAAATVPGQFATASAHALPLCDSSFDCIVIADVIEHLEAPERSLHEIRRIGKPGATVVISTPHIKGWLTDTWILSMLHEAEDRYMADYRQGYTAQSLSRLMESSGIEADTVRITNPFISQLFLGLVKLGYRSEKTQYTSQAELVSLSNNWKFQIYKQVVFPPIYWAGRLEEVTLGRWIPGHCLIIRGTVNK